MSAIRAFLQQRLAAGEWPVGQVIVRPDFTLRHVADGARLELEVFTRPEHARELAKYAADGAYRPLKTAPNLRRGWLLELASLDEVRLALDYLYPGAIGTRVAFERGDLSAVPLRDTLVRQTGMYRVTQHITDAQAGAVIRNLCVEGCLRLRLWDLAEVRASQPKGDAILCAEACNLLVAACRPVAKENLSKAGAKP